MTLALALVVVSITGFIALSYEILWFRALSFATGGAPAVFGLLLGAYLAGLAVGSFASSLFCRNRAALGNRTYLRHIAAFVLLANLFGFLVLPLLAWVTTRSGSHPAFGLIALSSAMLGAVFPLVSHFAVAPDRLAGTHLSYLYAANIAGSVLGSFLTGFVLLEALPIRTIAASLMIVGGVTVIILLALGGVRGGVLAGSSVLVAGLTGCAVAATPRLFDRFYEKLLPVDQSPTDARFRDVVENRSGVITVTQNGTVYGGGAYDGRMSTDLIDDRNRIVRAYAISALHPAPRQVLLIGLGSGSWAQVIANNPQVERLTIVEINPGYLQIVAKYPQVASLLSNPKVKIVIDDGRRWLTRNDRRFDMIVSNTPFHWRDHSTNLLSVEYCRLVREHLRSGGVYYFNTTGSTAALKTAMVEYPYGMRVMSLAAVSLSPVVFDRARLEAILANYRIDGRPVVNLALPAERGRMQEVINSLEIETRDSILRRLATTPLVTDDNMLPEWHPAVSE
ncbi:MAG: spermidine synthase [Gemmatimonadales bacterium]|nr:spermidine synthase [Gemmatimonadales bacterium]